MINNRKYILTLILLLMLYLIIYKPISFSNILDGPNPTPPETKGELNITLSQNDFEILLGDRTTIEINLIAKLGNIPNFNLMLKLIKQPNDENKDFSWMNIEHNDRIYNINEKIYFDELKKDEIKALKINFNPDDKTKTGEYLFEIISSFDNTKFIPSNKIKSLVWEKGNLIINSDKNITSENPLIVGIDTSENINFYFKFDKNKKIEGLNLEIETTKLPFGLKKEDIDWIYINKNIYKFGDKFQIKDLSQILTITFSPSRIKNIDFEGDYEFNFIFNIVTGNIIEPENGLFRLYLKVVKFGELKFELSKESLELEKGTKDEFYLYINSVNGQLINTQVKFEGDNNLKWLNFEYENNLYYINDFINIPIIIEGDKKIIKVNINTNEETLVGNYKIKMIIYNEKIKFSRVKEIEIKILEPKLGVIDIINKEELSKVINFYESVVKYEIKLKAINGNVRNIKFKLLPINTIYNFDYTLEPNAIDRLKDNEIKIVNLILNIPEDFKKTIENKFNFLEKFNFKFEIHYNNENINDKNTISFCFDVKIIELKINKKIIYVNNEPKELEVPPQIIQNRTYLPIRYILEPLGAKLIWEQDEKKVKILFKDITIELWIGKNIAKINENYKLIDSTNPKVVPLIINGRTMLPIRFVAENLGCRVDWDSYNQTIKIIYFGR